MMHLIEKYAQAAASTARLPLNSPARRAADEKEMALRAEVKNGVAGMGAERDELRARLASNATPEGWKLVKVKAAEFDNLMYWLERCESKGHMEQCSDLIEPWYAFDYAEVAAPEHKA